MDTKKRCFHCGKDESNLLSCEIWDVRTCRACRKRHHVGHHEQCTKLQSAEEEEEETLLGPKKTKGAETEYFYIRLTRFDGQSTRIRCRKGVELPLEEHWAGTYLIFTAGMVLVKENRDEINEKLLEGLRSIAI